MPFANDIYAALGEALNVPPAAIEPHGAALRKAGHWPPTKPGKGAIPLSEGAASLPIISLMLGGPAAIVERGPLDDTSVFLTYCNSAPINTIGVLKHDIIKKKFGFDNFHCDEPRFADYITSIIKLYSQGEIDQIVYYKPDPIGFREEYYYDGPEIIAAIKGPYPIATIAFQPSNALISEFKDAGLSDAEASKEIKIAFVHELYHLCGKNKEQSKEATSIGNLIEQLRKKTARGIRFERAVHGEVFDAIGKLYRSEK